MTEPMGQIHLNDVLITEELSRRSPRSPNLKAENDALRTLAHQLVEHPQTMLKTLVTIAKDLCQAGSAGVSLLETLPDGEEIFRWVAIAGALEPYEQGTASRSSSPCGMCLERQAPQLYSYPERYFAGSRSAEPPTVEALLIPLVAADHPLGVIWIVSHDPQRQFDAEDVRVMTGLADFTAAALRNSYREETLRQRETELSLITDTVPVLISFVDVEQRYRFTNHRYEEWFERSATDICGKALWEILGEAAYQKIRPYVEQALAGQQVTFENEIPFQRVGMRYVRVTYVPRFDAEGGVIGFVALVDDISRRKQAEAALRQSEERLRIAQQAAKAGVWDWDIITNQVIWSAEYYSLYGLDPTIIYPSYANWLASIAQADRDRVDQAAREALAQQTDLNVEFRVFHPVQGERWIMAIGQTFYDVNQHPIRMTGIALDITDRKQAEAELRESEARFRNMADTAPVLIWMSGTDKLSHYFNQPWLDFTGRTMDQARGNGWAEGVHPDDLQHCLETYTTAFDARQPFQLEYRLRRFDGVYRWIVDAAVPRFTADGDFLGYIGSCIDIEDRKQTEEALAQSEAQLRLMIESAKDYAIFTLDMEGAVTRWNSGAQRLLGYQESEIVGQDGRIIFTPEDLERGEADREVRRALSEGRAENERWHVRKDGSRFWGSGLMMPLHDEDHQVQGFLKILQDKTAQRQAEQRLYLLYETTSDLLATEQPMRLINTVFRKLSEHLELHCYYNFMVEEKDNRSMLHLKNYSGISEAAAQTLEWIEFGQHLCGLAAAERRPIVLNRVQIANHPQAQLVCALGITAYAGYPLVAQGRLLGTLSFASLTRTGFTPEEIDLLQVTCAQIAIALERANLTASLQQQAEQLRRANRIKDEFLAVLSHELRSPLNPILGWTQLLRTRQLDEAKTMTALATIERNARLQVELIDDLLDVSRILQGKLSLEMTAVDLGPTIQAAMETVRLAAEAKSIQLQTNLDTTVGKILGDPVRLQQVIWNLLSNAVKFTPAGGRVEVRLETVMGQGESVMGDGAVVMGSGAAVMGQELSSIPHALVPMPHYAQIIITDTGKGIAPDFLPYVFDYFRQADSATTRQFGGLGLGLAIVRHLVELHGGTIQADSSGEGLGATFTVRLPLIKKRDAGDEMPETDRAASVTPPQYPLTDLHILVVDDDVDTRELITFFLEQAGAKVVAASSAHEGLIAVRRNTFDLLLSDIGMPDMDGYMLLRQIRTLSPEQGGQIPAIALTAYASEIDYQQAMAAGFQQHVTKPVEPKDLISAIISLVWGD